MHFLVNLIPNQGMHAITLGETIDKILLVFPHPPDQI